MEPVAVEPEVLERDLEEVGFIKRKGPPKREKPVLLCAADVEPLPVYWLWRPYIPQGMVTLISGDPGLGKSWMTMSIAADISAGRSLPGSSLKMPPRKVLVMNLEDSWPHTIAPRLIALKANMSNVVYPERGFPLDPEGIALMASWLNEASVGLVFIDPLVAALGAGVDMHKANEVRAVMAALSDVAHKSGAAIVAVRHLRKSGRGEGGKAIYAGLGSIDFTGAARSELLVEKARDGTRVVRHIKCNVGPLGPTMAYHYSEFETTDKRGEPVTSQRFEWLGLYEGTDQEDMDGRKPVFKVDAAKNWLRVFLAEGPKLAADVVKAGELKDFNLKMLKKAKIGLAESVKVGDHWYWQLLDRPAAVLDPAILAEAQARLAKAA